MRRTLIGALVITLALAGMQIGIVLPDHAAAPKVALADRTLSLLDSVAGAQGAPGVIRPGTLIELPGPPTFDLQVLGSYDIFLARQSYPFVVGGSYGTDAAGPNSPQEVPVTVPAHAGVTFSVRTITPALPGRDANGMIKGNFLGGSRESGATPSGVSSLVAPSGGLVGVFTGNSRARTIPPTLDFSTQHARDTTVLKPLLNQVFFIGTGKTGKGATKVFLVPAGAVKLSLALFNHLGASHGARGEFVVSVRGNAPSVQPYLPIETVTPVPTATVIITAPVVQDTVFPTDTPTPGVASTATPGASTVTPVLTQTPLATATGVPQATSSATSTVTTTATPTTSATATATSTVSATPTSTVFVFPTPHA